MCENRNVMEFENGDLYDIGQVVNGVSRFVLLNHKWWSFEKEKFGEYEGSHVDLSDWIRCGVVVGDEGVKYLGNVFDGWGGDE